MKTHHIVIIETLNELRLEVDGKPAMMHVVKIADRNKAIYDEMKARAFTAALNLSRQGGQVKFDYFVNM